MCLHHSAVCFLSVDSHLPCVNVKGLLLSVSWVVQGGEGITQLSASAASSSGALSLWSHPSVAFLSLERPGMSGCDSRPLPVAAPGSTSRAAGEEVCLALGLQAGIDGPLCSGMGWPFVGPLLGLGSQFTGWSGALELHVTCLCVLPTFSPCWGNQAT